MLNTPNSISGCIILTPKFEDKHYNITFSQQCQVYKSHSKEKNIQFNKIRLERDQFAKLKNITGNIFPKQTYKQTETNVSHASLRRYYEEITDSMVIIITSPVKRIVTSYFRLLAYDIFTLNLGYHHLSLPVKTGLQGLDGRYLPYLFWYVVVDLQYLVVVYSWQPCSVFSRSLSDLLFLIPSLWGKFYVNLCCCHCSVEK